MRGGVSGKRALAATAVAAGVLATPFIYNKMTSGEQVQNETPKLFITYVTAQDISLLMDFYCLAMSGDMKTEFNRYFRQSQRIKIKQLNLIVAETTLYDSLKAKYKTSNLNQQQIVSEIKLVLEPFDIAVFSTFLHLLLIWYQIDCLFTTLLLRKQQDQQPQIMTVNDYVKFNTLHLLSYMCHYHALHGIQPDFTTMKTRFPDVTNTEFPLLSAVTNDLVMDNKGVNYARRVCLMKKHPFN
jgi:hypothetical protein